MYYVVFFKHNKKVIDIKTESFSDNDSESLLITNEEKKEILKGLNDGYFVHYIENKVVLKINEANKRKEIVSERDVLLEETEPYFLDRYGKRILNLTTEEDAELLLYYDELLAMPNHFDSSELKEEWSFIFVDYADQGTRTSTDSIYYLNKPNFIK